MLILDAKVRQKSELTKRKGTFLLLGHKSLPGLVIIEDAYLCYLTLRFVNILYCRLCDIFSRSLMGSIHLRLTGKGRRDWRAVRRKYCFRPCLKRRITGTISASCTSCRHSVHCAALLSATWGSTLRSGFVLYALTTLRLVHWRRSIEHPVDVDLRKTFMDSVHDTERRIGLSVEDIAQRRRRTAYHLGEGLLGEVLVLHQLSNPIFHALLRLSFILSRIDVFFPNRFFSEPFLFTFTKVKQKFRITKDFCVYLDF